MFKADRQCAFSLVEILCVLALVAILLVISAPSLRVWYQRYQLETISRRVSQSLTFARLAAIHQQRAVTYCGSLDGLHCDGSWALGQIVVTDANQVLQYKGSLAEGYCLSWRGNVGLQQGIEWQADGTTVGQGRFSIWRCDAKDERVELVISISGRVR